MLKRLLPASLVLAAVACLGLVNVLAAADTLPDSLSDKDFWALSDQISEPNGSFRSDNLLSNELTLSTVAAQLSQITKPGGVYVGVGPEQNFSYIAAIKPKMALICDIRRGNLELQLMYKALFEMSADRADFMSKLFTKPRPAGLATSSSAAQIMNAYWDATTSDEATYKKNLQAIDDWLTKKHGLPLSSDDLAGIEYVYHSFYWFGPSINYNSSSGGGAGNFANRTYADLMATVDQASGRERSYLSSEETFGFMKTMEQKNLLVPFVGDFAGPKALKGIGKYVKDHGAIVTAFYVSNVEQYLNQNGVWGAFCQNFATFPVDAASVFIRPGGMGGRGSYDNQPFFSPIAQEAKSCGG